MADKANLVEQFIQLLKHLLCNVRSGIVMKNWAHSVDQCLVQALGEGTVQNKEQEVRVGSQEEAECCPKTQRKEAWETITPDMETTSQA